MGCLILGMQKTTKLHWVMGLTLGLCLASCSVSQRYHNRGLNIQWRSGGKQVSTEVKGAAQKATLDHPHVKETKTKAMVEAKDMQTDQATMLIESPKVRPRITRLVYKPNAVILSLRNARQSMINELKVKTPPPSDSSVKYHKKANTALTMAILSLTPLGFIFLFQVLAIGEAIEAKSHTEKGSDDYRKAVASLVIGIITFIAAAALWIWIMIALDGWEGPM